MSVRNIRGLTLAELEEFALSVGEKKYRGKQLFGWLYGREATTFEAMSSLSRQFRERLETAATIESITLLTRQESDADGTVKFLFGLQDGKRIESVLIPPRVAFRGTDAEGEDEQQRLTLCVSTQVGCPLDCSFCATASMGLLRNLHAGEIVSQVIEARRISGRKITNLVYMGMGEPLMNYEQVMNSVEIMISGLRIAARRITISTAGWIPGIRRMADEDRKVKLAISLHSLDPGVRTTLMPITKRYPLHELLNVIEAYSVKVRRRVTFEYILFDGVNDREEDLRQLVALGRRIPCKINVIPFHAVGPLLGTPSGRLRPSPPARSETFVRRLREAHLSVFVRSSAGEDIDAACGQLAVRHDRKQGNTVSLPAELGK